MHHSGWPAAPYAERVLEGRFVARIVAGIVGWLLSILPLVVVNGLGYANLLDTQEAVLAGAAALLGGIALGGAAAGLLGGRQGRARPGGVGDATIAGLLAALLFAATLSGVVLTANALQISPAIVAEHPIRIGLVIVFLAALLLMSALASGVLARRGQPMQPAARPTRTESWSRPGSARPQATTSMPPATTRYPAPIYPDDPPPGRYPAPPQSQPRTAAARRGARPPTQRDEWRP